LKKKKKNLGGVFPLFPICSLKVPNGFSLGSHYVPQGVFPKQEEEKEEEIRGG